MTNSTGVVAALAPAKVNLFLHVGPSGPDGYHPISSLMVFAHVGDQVRISPAERLSLQVAGPFAAQAGPDGQNLALRAAEAFAAPGGSWRIELEKHLPVGAGLGGGSADAAAVLRLLCARSGRDPRTPEVLQLAAGLGSDVPACLYGAPVVAQGRGERLSPGPPMAPVAAVLVHPGRAVSTARVYAAFDALTSRSASDCPPLPPRFNNVSEVADLLATTRNDLEPIAASLEPVIAEVLHLLRRAPECLAARMSGSGSACFAVCRDGDAAGLLAARVTAERPEWWVRACSLGGPWP